MTSNDRERGLERGSLGTIIEAYDNPLPIVAGEDRNELSLGLVQWDDESLHPILLNDVDNALKQLSYCLSVHQAQGSKFERVIIPVPDIRSLIIDRYWLYTAATRAKHLVIFVGKSDHIAKVISETPKSRSRVSALRPMLERL